MDSNRRGLLAGVAVALGAPALPGLGQQPGRKYRIGLGFVQGEALVVNLKTARSLGVKVPGAVLARADKVIE